jgi:organic hydroperoxide reductase OsmC/OhrA
MPLEMKATCELCASPLELAGEAWICSFECTYCPKCAAGLGFECKNCGGELVGRPRRGRLSRQAFGAVHRAEVTWQRGDAAFVDRRYSRVHRWAFEGGPVLRASSSPHVVPVPMSDPAAVDPEGAFVAALSSCHMLWFLDLAARAGLVVDRYEDQAEGILITESIETSGTGTESHPSLGKITLRPVVTFAAGADVPAELFARLHHQAHERCFLANALEVPPTVVPTLRLGT